MLPKLVSGRYDKIARYGKSRRRADLWLGSGNMHRRKITGVSKLIAVNSFRTHEPGTNTEHDDYEV
jgi:hypothetical protein